jgi:hypothetical protein
MYLSGVKFYLSSHPDQEVNAVYDVVGSRNKAKHPKEIVVAPDIGL